MVQAPRDEPATPAAGRTTSRRGIDISHIDRENVDRLGRQLAHGEGFVPRAKR